MLCLPWACGTPAGPRGVQASPQSVLAPATSVPPSTPSATSGSEPLEKNSVPDKVVVERRAMGTRFTLASYPTPKTSAAQVREAFDRALHEVDRLEGLMTTWRDDSEVSRINQAAGTHPVAVSPETFHVIAAGLQAGTWSQGAFDITFESLHGLWKFDQDLDPHPPSPEAVALRLPLVDFRKVRLDEGERTVFLEKPGAKLGLGGIAKGYAVDRAAEVLREAGLENFYVQGGGDLFAAGTKPDGSPWMAGIRDPRAQDRRFFAILPLTNHAFSTAGDYERSYLVGARRYHHIIDPKTGFPATACRSVTVWAPTALLADQLDDAIFILGPSRGLRLIESMPEVGAVIVDAKNNLWISERIRPLVQITRVPEDAP